MIDIQINGAYGFDFSVYDGDDKAYQSGLRNVAERIVETGVTALAVSVLARVTRNADRQIPVLFPP